MVIGEGQCLDSTALGDTMGEVLCGMEASTRPLSLIKPVKRCVEVVFVLGMVWIAGIFDTKT